MIIPAGIVSYVCPSTSMVLHSSGPHTSQHGLCSTLPLIQYSSRRLLIQIRLDCKGSFLNSATESSSFSKMTPIPNGARDFVRADTAFSSSSSVDPHLGQVSPPEINRCHLILRSCLDSLTTDTEGEHPHLSMFILSFVITIASKT